MNPVKDTFKKIGDFAQDWVDVLIPKAVHRFAQRRHMSPRAETILGYAAAAGLGTVTLIAGFAGAVAVPIIAVAAGIFGSPVVAAAIATVIPVGVVAGYMGMAMSESRALGDGYFGYAHMKEKMFPSPAVSREEPNKNWTQKIRGVFSRVATKALPADQSPQILPQPAHPAQPRP